MIDRRTAIAENWTEFRAIYLFVNRIVANEGLEGNVISNRGFFIQIAITVHENSMKILSSHEFRDRITLYPGMAVVRHSNNPLPPLSLLAHDTRVSFLSLYDILKCRYDFRIVGRMRYPSTTDGRTKTSQEDPLNRISRRFASLSLFTNTGEKGR